MSCHAGHLISRILRIIPWHVVLRTRHRRQVPVDGDSLHAEEVLAYEADLPVDVGRVLGVVVLQREAVAVVHEALWEESASDLENKEEGRVEEGTLTWQSGTSCINKLQNASPATTESALF